MVVCAATRVLAPYPFRSINFGAHHMFLGTLLYETGDYAASFHQLTDAAHYFRHTGDPRSLTMTRAHLHCTALQNRVGIIKVSTVFIK